MAEEGYRTLIVKKNNPNAYVTFSSTALMKNITDTKTYASVDVPEGALVQYTIFAEGTESVSKQLVISKDIELEPVLKQYVTLTINPNPSDAVVILECNGKKYEQKSLTVLDMETVKYTVSKKYYETVSDTVILNGDRVIDITLLEEINDNVEPIITEEGLEEPSDADIGKYEGGVSDKQTDITLLPAKEYNKLSSKQKSDYVRYDPWLETFLGADIGNAMNKALVDMYWALPIVSKLSPFLQGFQTSTLAQMDNPVLRMISQFNSVLQSAQTVGDRIKSIQRICNKLGLGKLPDILFTAFKVIGAGAGLAYAMMYNPQILLQPYQEMFKNFDVNAIMDRTVLTTLPQLRYVIDALKNKNVPEGDIKEDVIEMIDELTQASEIITECYKAIDNVKQILNINVNVQNSLNDVIQTMATMGTNWALGAVTDAINDMKLNFDKIQQDMMNGDFQKKVLESMNKIKKVHDIEPKYINVHDLETLKEMNGGDTGSSTLTQYEYTNGYEDSLRNGKDGETEEQMEARLYKYKVDMEAQGKDPTAYINGYKMGFLLGQKLLEAERNNLNSEDKQKSYTSGYEQGVAFAKGLRSQAIDNLTTEEHTPSEEEILAEMNRLYEEEKIRIESTQPESDTNPYFAEGWNAGYDSYKQELDLTHKDVEEDSLGEQQGDIIASGVENDGYIRTNEQCDEECFIKLNSSLKNYMEMHPYDYIYYEQGLIRGANNFQSMYNEGYSSAWWSAMNKNDYDGETPAEKEETANAIRLEMLTDYCTSIGTTIAEQESLEYRFKDGRYRGWIEGWSARYNNRFDNPDYKEMYYYPNQYPDEI